MLPEKQPKTQAEAEEIVQSINLLPQQEPGERKINSYREDEVISIRNLAPNFPCEGLPLPRFTGARWNQETQDKFRIMKGKSIVKHMLARFLPVSIPLVDVYVLKAKMTGTHTSTLENVGEVLLATGSLQNWLKVKSYELLDGFRSGSSPVQPGRALQLTFTFEKSGWDAVKELWNYMWSRSIEVDIKANVHVDGYETADYSVDAYDKVFTVNATLPVDKMNWHAW